jgi:D-alanyl-D-alanine carboxypeptidase
MIRLPRVIFVLLLACIAASGQSDTLAARLDRAYVEIGKVVQTSSVPGMVVGITDRNGTLKIFTHGYADVKTKAPITGDSLFEIGSITKSFTAITLMQLMDEGRFDPQAPITKYLPWFEVKSKFAPITGHHLLTHTAGIPNYRPDLASMPYATYSLRDFEVSYAPGKHYWYSDIGFQTLGYVVERIEGVPYHTVIERRIFNRLGMGSSKAVIDDELRAKLAVSYAQWPYTNEYLEQPWFEYRAADGSVASTVGDMLTYARLILNRGKTPKGRVLSERAFQMLTTPALNSYGYGLFVRSVDGNTVISHGGTIAGFHSSMEAYMNDGFGIVALGNATLNASVDAWIANTVKAAIRNEPLPKFPERPTPEQVRSTAAQWAGIYTGSGGMTLEFVATTNGLALKKGDSTAPLTRVGRDAYASDAGDLMEFPFAFERDGGKVVAVSHGSDWFHGAAYKRPTEFKTPPEFTAFVGRYEKPQS